MYKSRGISFVGLVVIVTASVKAGPKMANIIDSLTGNVVLPTSVVRTFLYFLKSKSLSIQFSPSIYRYRAY